MPPPYNHKKIIIMDFEEKRQQYEKLLKSETILMAYLDLTNMFHWQNVLGWRFRIEDVISRLLAFPNIKEVKVYYGFNEKDKQNSEAFHNRIKKSGAILRTKPMKFIRKNIDEALFFQRRTMTLF